MTDKILYFVRHGEAESNANHFFAGQADVPLTALGIEQAKATAPLLAHIPFDKVFCSDLQRAKSTAALALPHCKCEYTAEIREISVGELAFQKIDLCAAKYGEVFLNARKNVDYSAFGGESYEELMARAQGFLDRVAALENASVVGAFCHGGLIRAAANCVLGRCAIAMPDNCAIAKFACKDGKWTLCKWNVTVEI